MTSTIIMKQAAGDPSEADDVNVHIGSDELRKEAGDTKGDSVSKVQRDSVTRDAEGKSVTNVLLDSVTSNAKEDRVTKVPRASVTSDANGDGESDVTSDDAGREDDTSNLPIDRGWAWVVLAAAVFQIFLWGGLMRSFGIFFVVYQERFRSSASETSLIATIQNVVFSVSAMFVMTAGLKNMSARTSIVIGVIVNFVAYLATAFTKDIRILYICHGVLSGLCNAMVFLPMVSMIGVYFNKRRALANSIYSSGASLGGLTFGPIYAWLFDEYGYTGTMLITSGFLFNVLISGVLMRPIEQFSTVSKNKPLCTVEEGNPLISKDFHDSNASSVFAASETVIRNGRDSGHESIDSYKDTSDDSRTDNAATRIVKPERTAFTRTFSGPATETELSSYPGQRHQHNFPNLSRTVSYDPTHMEHRQFPSPALKRRLPAGARGSLRHRTVSELSRDVAVRQLISSGDYMCGSLANVNIQNCMDSIELRVEQDENGKHKTCFGHFMHRTVVFLKTVFDIKLLKDPVFIVFLFLASTNLPGSVLTTIFIIPHAKDMGVTTPQAGIILFVISCVDLMARLSCGVIADRKWARPTTIVATAAAILGLMTNLLHFFHTFETLLVFAVVTGLCGGIYISLYASILIDLLGVERFASSIGFANMCHGAGIAAFYPIIGYLRDTTGAYYLAFHIQGIVLFISALLALALPYVATWHGRRQSRATT